MRHVAVAVPTNLAFANSRHHVIDLACIDQCGVEVGVTAYAVVHDYLVGGFAWTWSLTFEVGDKLGYVVETIGCLEEILACNVLVRHMTIVASGIASMA